MKIAITRMKEKKDDTQAVFRQYGHEAIILHTMTTAPPRDPQPLRRLAEQTQQGSIDYLLFTSSLSVEKFLEHCKHIPPATCILCVGPRTAQTLQQHGYTCKTLNTYNADHFKEHLEHRAGGKTIGLPRADVPNPGLIQQLQQLGATVIEAPAYQLKPAEEGDNKQKIQSADAVLFTSGKSYEYSKTTPADLQNKIIIALGPKTAQTLKQYNITPHITGNGTIEDCLEQLNQYHRDTT